MTGLKPLKMIDCHVRIVGNRKIPGLNKIGIYVKFSKTSERAKEIFSGVPFNPSGFYLCFHRTFLDIDEMKNWLQEHELNYKIEEWYDNSEF
jgi:hypothetical protein